VIGRLIVLDLKPTILFFPYVALHQHTYLLTCQDEALRLRSFDVPTDDHVISNHIVYIRALPRCVSARKRIHSDGDLTRAIPGGDEVPSLSPWKLFRIPTELRESKDDVMPTGFLDKRLPE